MRERPGMAEKIVAAREKARGRNKEAAALTQWGNAEAGPATPQKERRRRRRRREEEEGQEMI